jgi:arginase
MIIMKPEVNIISAGYGHGQRKEGVEKAPTHVLSDTLMGKLKPKMHLICENVPLEETDQASSSAPYSLHRPGEVGKSALRVYEAVKKAVINGSSCLVVGGDHSIAIGSIAAQLEKHTSENLGVIWVDAHADINTLKTTESGNIHGCPVAILMGLEHTTLQPFNWLSSRRELLKPENIVYIGLRDVEPAEEEILARLNVRRYYMKKVKELGIDRVLDEALNHLSSKKLYLSFDIDGLDPSIAPATGTPVPDGLSMEEGLKIVKRVNEKKDSFVGMDLVEVNPSLAENEEGLNKTLQASQKIIMEAFGKP